MPCPCQSRTSLAAQRRKRRTKKTTTKTTTKRRTVRRPRARQIAYDMTTGKARGPNMVGRLSVHKLTGMSLPSNVYGTKSNPFSLSPYP
jgi:hypothetical protein